MKLKARKTVKVVRENGIAWTYINRPEKKNCMNPQVHADMAATLDELEADDETKVVVIAGAGGVFSAGQDLKEFFRALENQPAEAKRVRLLSNHWQWDRMTTFDKPTIAMVEGYCVGGAFSHLLGTDFAPAHTTAPGPSSAGPTSVAPSSTRAPRPSHSPGDTSVACTCCP